VRPSQFQPLPMNSKLFEGPGRGRRQFSRMELDFGYEDDGIGIVGEIFVVLVVSAIVIGGIAND